MRCLRQLFPSAALLLSFYATVLLAGCTGTQALPPSTPPLQQVLVAPDVLLTLPPPHTLGRPLEAVQLVIARHGTDIFTFEGRLSITPDTLTLVGSDLLGRRAMTLHWDGQTLQVDQAPWLPTSLPARNILADIILLYWPLETLKAHLADATAEDWSSANGTYGRTVLHRNQPLIEIRHDGPVWSGASGLTNLVWSYTLTIRSQEVLQ